MGVCLHQYLFSFVKLNKSSTSLYWATVLLFANVHIGIFEQFKFNLYSVFPHFYRVAYVFVFTEVFLFALKLEKSEGN